MKVWNRLLSGIKRLLHRQESRSMYAVADGRYKGEFFVYMEKLGNICVFLSLPDLQIRHIPINEFESGLDAGVLDRVESLPLDVHEVCKQQYTKLKNNPGTASNVPSKHVSNT
jgi:hypothetical protein